MSNLKSPSGELKSEKFRERLFLDTTEEALEAAGFKVVREVDETDGVQFLSVSRSGDETRFPDLIFHTPTFVNVTEDGRLYAINEMGLNYLKAALGIGQ